MKMEQLTVEEMEILLSAIIEQKWAILDDLYHYSNEEGRKGFLLKGFVVSMNLLNKIKKELKEPYVSQMALLEKNFSIDWKKKTNQTVSKFLKMLIDTEENSHPIN